LANKIALSSADRILVVAPHPDDETIATGFLLQRAKEVGADIRVVFLTDGGSNKLAQIVYEKRFNISETERRQWEARRRDEALAALKELGLPRQSACFAALPDSEINQIFMRRSGTELKTLCDLIVEFKPSILVLPSPLDLHPDHNSLWPMLASTLRLAAPSHQINPKVFFYVVHPACFNHTLEEFIEKGSEQYKQKRLTAFRMHKSQLVFGERRMARLMHSEEHFHAADFILDQKFRSATVVREVDDLTISFIPSLWFFSLGGVVLNLAGRGDGAELLSRQLKIPLWGGEAVVLEGAPDVTASAVVGADRVTVRIKGELIGNSQLLWAKISSPRILLYDQSGWFPCKLGEVKGTLSLVELLDYW